MRRSTSDLNKFEKLRREKAMAAHADEKAREGRTFSMKRRYEAEASRIPATFITLLQSAA